MVSSWPIPRNKTSEEWTRYALPTGPKGTKSKDIKRSLIYSRRVLAGSQTGGNGPASHLWWDTLPFFLVMIYPRLQNRCVEGGRILRRRRQVWPARPSLRTIPFLATGVIDLWHLALAVATLQPLLGGQWNNHTASIDLLKILHRCTQNPQGFQNNPPALCVCAKKPKIFSGRHATSFGGALPWPWQIWADGICYHTMTNYNLTNTYKKCQIDSICIFRPRLIT